MSLPWSPLDQLLAFSLGGPELIVIIIIILLLFGGTKIPQLMRGVGRGMGEFQKGVEEGKHALQKFKDEANRAGTSTEADETNKE